LFIRRSSRSSELVAETPGILFHFDRRTIMKSFFAAAAMLTGALVIQPAAVAAQTYDLPLFADDLQPLERASTFDHAQSASQKFGYDISMRRLNDGDKWTSLKEGVTEAPGQPKNANRVIYGKPFYAMRDGTIVSCWRNAPENPRPFISGDDEEKEPWLHPEKRAGRIGGGGNHVFIVHDDGTLALYAHAQPGTVPSALCPHDAALLPAVAGGGTPPENELGLDMRGNVPAGQRVRVRSGDFLGRVGNSGNSKGPHLHVHVAKKGPDFDTNNDDWVGVPLTFRRGLAQPSTSGTVDMDKWTSFSGQIIPKGNTVFWPPTRLSPEYARHGFDDRLMQRMWTHLANSGFMPVVLDCYGVAGEVFYNMVWRQGDGNFRGYFGQSSAELQQRADKAKEDGLAPVFVESCSSRHGTRYAVVFKKVAGAYRMRHGMSTTEHDDTLELAKKEGLSPVNVSVVSAGNSREYTVLYRKEPVAGWLLKSQIPESDYQAMVLEQVEAGRYPVYLSVYKHDGKNWMSAVFAKAPSPNWTARHDMTAAKYQAEYNAARGARMLTRTIAGYDGAISNHVFAAMWRK
jgi:hypothetical protein